MYSLKGMRNNIDSFIHAGACKYIRTGNADWRERVIMVNLLVLNSSAPSHTKTIIIFYKTAFLNEEVRVLWLGCHEVPRDQGTLSLPTYLYHRRHTKEWHLHHRRHSKDWHLRHAKDWDLRHHRVLKKRQRLIEMSLTQKNFFLSLLLTVL